MGEVQSLPYDEIKFDKGVNIEHILDTENISDIENILEVDLKYPVTIKKKTKTFPFFPENKNSPQDKFSGYMNEMKSTFYAPCKKLICGVTDGTNYLLHYRMLNFNVKNGMVVKKFVKKFRSN